MMMIPRRITLVPLLLDNTLAGGRTTETITVPVVVVVVVHVVGGVGSNLTI
jgi:hypothetical protein